MSHYKGWIGVDLDGTLAMYDKWRGPTHIGAPIPGMVKAVKHWLSEGKNVRIFTARAYAPPDNPRRKNEVVAAKLAIYAWCEEHIGQILPVTCVKDYDMIALYDDRAVQVIPNLGMTLKAVAMTLAATNITFACGHQRNTGGTLADPSGVLLAAAGLMKEETSTATCGACYLFENDKKNAS